MTTIMTCKMTSERARMLSQWIQTAAELRVRMGNLFAFASVMEALISDQVIFLIMMIKYILYILLELDIILWI